MLELAIKEEEEEKNNNLQISLRGIFVVTPVISKKLFAWTQIISDGRNASDLSYFILYMINFMLRLLVVIDFLKT